MKIRSNFKDYYDYVEYLSSPEGGDPKVVYMRTKLGDPKESGYGMENGGPNARGLPLFPSPIPKWFNRDKGYDPKDKLPWKFKWCVVCGKFYLLIAERNPKGCLLDFYGDPILEPNYFAGYKNWKLVTVDHPVWEHVYLGRSIISPEPLTQDTISRRFLGHQSDGAITIARAVNAPAFTIAGSGAKWEGGRWVDDHVSVERIIPNLGSLGFASLVPAERMYQELALFVGNVLSESPDVRPPAEVSDKERLVQKGFDLKTSFRGKPVK
jgi:hypothetical protein